MLLPESLLVAFGGEVKAELGLGVGDVAAGTPAEVGATVGAAAVAVTLVGLVRLPGDGSGVGEMVSLASVVMMAALSSSEPSLPIQCSQMPARPTSPPSARGI